MGFQRDHADVIGAAVETDDEVVLRQLLRHTLAPLDHEGGPVEFRVEVEVLQLGQVTAQPIGVDMHQRHP